MYTLITGASSGIGKALAMECAERGMHILLIALPGEELNAIEKTLQETYKVQCHVLGIDLSADTAAHNVYDWVKKNNYQVNILLNNVGLGSKGAFETIAPEFYHKQINLNILTTCLMTRLFFDDLKAHKPSYIMNMGSMGGFYTLPEKAVYVASKAFVYAFSKTLRLELEGSGISVSVVCPGGIDSNSNTIASNSELKGLAKASILQPEELAKEAINKMLNGQAVIIPGGVNRFIYGISKIVPGFLQNLLVRRAFERLKKQKY